MVALHVEIVCQESVSHLGPLTLHSLCRDGMSIDRMYYDFTWVELHAVFLLARKL